MTKRDRRQKASDVFRETEPVFGRKVSFEEAFPAIAGVTVEVIETGSGIQGERRRIYNKGRIGEYIDCSNPLCYRGGFSIGSILHDMVRNRETQRETQERCQGYEGSPKGRRKYKDCFNFFRIKVSITYSDTEK